MSGKHGQKKKTLTQKWKNTTTSNSTKCCKSSTQKYAQKTGLNTDMLHAILRTLKTSLVPINHVMHPRSYDFLYLLHHHLLWNPRLHHQSQLLWNPRWRNVLILELSSRYVWAWKTFNETIILHKIKSKIFINFQHINVLTALDECVIMRQVWPREVWVCSPAKNKKIFITTLVKLKCIFSTTVAMQCPFQSCPCWFTEYYRHHITWSKQTVLLHHRSWPSWNRICHVAKVKAATSAHCI